MRNCILAVSVLIPVMLILFGCGPKVTDVEMFTQANQLQREGKYDEAIGIYDNLIAKYPASTYGPQAQFMIGFIYANEVKNLDKAKEAYEKFLKAYPEHEMAKDAKWELDHLGQDIDDIEALIKSNSDSTKQE